MEEIMLMGIAVKVRSRAPMVTLTEAVVDTAYGIVGDHRGTGGRERKRQITVLSANQWDAACRDLGVSLPWQTRRANLFVDNLTFSQQDVGKYLHIGADVVLEITGETNPCNRMDEEHSGLQAALEDDWRGGVTCRVVHGGLITVGDTVVLQASASQSTPM